MNKLLNWVPKQGIYQCVLPKGKVHVDVYIDGRSPQTVTLENGEEVELYEREIRNLKRSEILINGYLAPTYFFEKDEEDNQVQVPATEDPENLNVISDDYIYVRTQGFKDVSEFVGHLDKLTSILTVERFRTACVDLDTPQSFVRAADERLQQLREKDEKQMYAGPIDKEREKFLTEKVKKS